MADDGAVTRPVRTPLVLARAFTLALVALASGTAAHLSAHGLLPPAPAMVLLLALGTALTASLLRRPASRARVVVLVVAGQTGVHLALTLLAGHRDDGVAPVQLGPAAALEHLREDATGSHAAMALAHLAAAAAVGLWLASGERALWAVLRLLVAPLVTLGCTAPPALSRLAATAPLVAPVLLRPADPARPRGPP